MRFVAFLRGVNVGGANLVPMAEFRKLLESLDLHDVRTLLNSGNAVFESGSRSATGHAARIASALAEKLGVAVPVIVKTARDIEAVLAENVLAQPANLHSQLLVAFAQDPKTLAQLSSLTALVKRPERIHLGRHALYLYCAIGIRESKAAAALLGKIGRLVTTRNWATVLKIAELMEVETKRGTTA